MVVDQSRRLRILITVIRYVAGKLPLKIYIDAWCNRHACSLPSFSEHDVLFDLLLFILVLRWKSKQMPKVSVRRIELNESCVRKVRYNEGITFYYHKSKCIRLLIIKVEIYTMRGFNLSDNKNVMIFQLFSFCGLVLWKCIFGEQLCWWCNKNIFVVVIFVVCRSTSSYERRDTPLNFIYLFR